MYGIFSRVLDSSVNILVSCTHPGICRSYHLLFYDPSTLLHIHSGEIKGIKDLYPHLFNDNPSTALKQVRFYQNLISMISYHYLK